MISPREAATALTVGALAGAVAGGELYGGSRLVAETPHEYNQNAATCADQIRALGGGAVQMVGCQQFSGSFVFKGELVTVKLEGKPAANFALAQPQRVREEESVGFLQDHHMTETDFRHQRSADKRLALIGGGVVALLSSVLMVVPKSRRRKQVTTTFA